MDYYSAYGGGSRGGNFQQHHQETEEIVNDVVRVPLRTGEAVNIALSDLPDVAQLIDLLRKNRVRLNIWVNLALLYYRASRLREFETLLTPENQHGAESDYSGRDRDQMRSLDMLAAYYVQQGSKEKNQEARKDWFIKATLLYTTADKIIMYDQNHLLGRAYFCLLEGNKVEQAEIQFKFVLNDEQRGGLAPPINDTLAIPAMMGQAAIMFMRKEYKNALQIYKKCLQMNPGCPPAVRRGIGYCLAKLGKQEKAKIAFQRVLQLDPEDVDAQAALAVLQMTCSQTGDEMRQGIQTLAQLYKAAKDQPLVLNHLANHFFIKSQLQETQDKESLLVKAKRLLDYAVTVTKNEQILSESNFHLARYFHTQGKIHDAHRHYYLASQQAAPKFKLPSYGYGQTNILLGEYEKAIDEFEKVHKVYPDNIDVLKVLGALYARQSKNESLEKAVLEERRKKAREFLEKAAKQNTDDMEILVDLATHLQSFDQNGALAIYGKIFNKVKEAEQPVPPEIMNNMGTLYFLNKKYKEARECFTDCRATFQTCESMDARVKAAIITTTYNLARCDEKLNKFAEAQRIYKGILKKRPSYMDAMFRLGCIHYNRGDFALATNHFKEVSAADPKSYDSLIMLGLICFHQGQLGNAQKRFEQILKNQKTEHADPLALVCMGNIWVKSLMDINRNRDKDPVNRERALSCFYKCLKSNPKNVYAMHGAGIVFAQKGDLNTAREFFGPVRERISDYPDVWINTAHVQLDSNQNQSAVVMYQTAARRFGHRSNTDLFTNIAFGYFKMGKYEQALDYLDRCIMLDLTNLVHRFNHCLTIWRWAKNVLEGGKSSEEKVNATLRRLTKAEETFSKIAGLPQQKVQPYRYISRTACKEMASKCQSILEDSAKFLDQAKKNDAEELQRHMDTEMERRRVLTEQRQAARQRAEAEQQELDQLRFRRTYFMQQTKDALKKIEIEEEPRRGGGGGGRKRKRQREDREFVDDSDNEARNDPEARKERRKNAAKASRRAKKKDRDFINDGTSDEDGGDKKKRRKKKDKQVEEEDLRKFKGKIKSKAIVESSSSSSESDNAAPPEETVPTIRSLPDDSSDSDAAPPARTFETDSDSSTNVEPAANAAKASKKRIVSDDSDSDTSEKPDKPTTDSDSE